MSLSNSQIKKIPEYENKTPISVLDGSGLYLIAKGKCKRFEGRMRFPFNRDGRTQYVRLGVWEKDLSVEEAIQRWLSIKSWAKKENKNPKKYFEDKNKKQSERSLKEAFNSLLEIKKQKTKERSWKTTENRLNQMLIYFGEDKLIKDFEIDNSGNELVYGLVQHCNAKGSKVQGHRLRRLLNEVFKHCSQRGWIKSNQNPAVEKLDIELLNYSPKGNPYLSWYEIPKFLDSINENSCKGTKVTDLALKAHLLMCTRVGVIVRLEWDWFDKERNLWVIPAQTSGLKNVLGDTNNEHLIPSTPEIQKVMTKAQEISGFQRYVFYSPEGKNSLHIGEETINDHLRNLGWKNKQSAHGWRDVIATYGQELFPNRWKSNVSLRDVISRQLGHKDHKQGTMGHYDNTEFLDQRREFMTLWSSELVQQGLKI